MTWLRECFRAAFRCLHSVVYYAGRQQSARKSDALQALASKTNQAEGSGEGQVTSVALHPPSQNHCHAIYHEKEMEMAGT